MVWRPRGNVPQELHESMNSQETISWPLCWVELIEKNMLPYIHFTPFPYTFPPTDLFRCLRRLPLRSLCASWNSSSYILKTCLDKVLNSLIKAVSLLKRRQVAPDDVQKSLPTHIGLWVRCYDSCDIAGSLWNTLWRCLQAVQSSKGKSTTTGKAVQYWGSSFFHSVSICWKMGRNKAEELSWHMQSDWQAPNAL